MSIEDRVKGIIEDTNASAIVIRGRWGEGKTYFWKQMVDRYARGASVVRPHYAYVSLFGVNSLADLRTALAQKIRNVTDDKEDSFGALLGFSGEAKDAQDARSAVEPKTDNSGWLARAGKLLGRTTKGWAALGSDASVSIEGVALGKLGPFYSAWAYSRVRKSLICLDDLERRGDGLALKDVMGLISQLVIERNCCVFAILNEETLEKDEEIWNKNKEKVFSGELLFSADTARASSYIYGEGPYSPDDGFAIRAMSDLRISNVRIIRRVKSTCDLAFEAVGSGWSDATRVAVIRGIVLLVYCYAGQGEGAPPIALAKGSHMARAIAAVARKNKEDRKPEEIMWEALLAEYGGELTGELNAALEDLVERGYPNVPLLTEAVHDHERAVEGQKLDDGLAAAWSLLHDQFGDNRDEIVEKMEAAFLAVADRLSSSNSDSSILLMRALGAHEVAEKMIMAWVAARSGERWKELSDREVSIFSSIKDVQFLEAIRAGYAMGEDETKPDFSEVFQGLRPHVFVSAEQLQILDAEPVERYVEFLLANASRSVNSSINTAISMGSREVPDIAISVRDKTIEALRRISKMSSTDAVRVQWIFLIPPEA